MEELRSETSSLRTTFAFLGAMVAMNLFAMSWGWLPAVLVMTGETDWVERVRYALNNRDFYTVQQSIVDLEGENEGLFENRTFMREEDGDTPASEFMPHAERNDLGSTIDRHIGSSSETR